MAAIDLAVYVGKQVGCLYASGAQGQELTAALIRKLEKDDKNYKRALASFNDHVAKGLSLIGFDCSGLIVKFLLDAGLIAKDKTANGLYHDECVDIGKNELQAGDLVFKKYLTKNQMYHVGVYMGDGTVVHAKGRDDGVVREPIGATGWNRFGRLKCFKNDGLKVVKYSRLLKNKKPYLRGDDVRMVQMALEANGFGTGGVDGVYGPKTESAVRKFQAECKVKRINIGNIDGIVGPKTWAALFG